MTQIVSSISGLEIYAPSAGYAPLDSASVSSIASGYQVVSATGTQLYAGTAFLTGVNGAPVSASRAGQAANASLANSAWYDGTGRFISALPDSAAVSAIASAYAESAASSKQDTLSFSYDDDKISAINGSALAGQGGATGDYVEKSALDVGIGSGNYSLHTSFTQGELNTANRLSFAQGNSNSASGTSFAQGKVNTSLFYSFAQGSSNSASSYSFAQGWANSASYHSFAQGFNNSAKNTVAVFGEFNLHGDGSTSTGNSAAFVIGDGTDATTRHDLMLVTKDGEITMFASTADTVGTGIMSSIRAISAAATGGGVDSATVSSIASSYAESAVSSKADSSALSSYALSSDVSGCIDTVSNNSASWGAGVSLPITGYAGADSATYGETSVEFTRYDTAGEPDIRTATLSPDALNITYTVDENDYYSVQVTENGIDFSNPDGYFSVTPYDITNWNSAVDTVANNSASWAQGGVDSATVSAIASSYVESGVSSKADSSALSSYALSADVSSTVDVVSSQSASWTQVVTSLSGNANFYNQINSKNISSTVSYKARCDENGNSISALYDTVSSNSASWGGGGAVTSPSGTIYVSGSTIEASNSALDVKYTPDWSAEINTEFHFSPNDGFTAAVSGSGNLYINIVVYEYDGADIYLYGLPDGVLIGSGTYEYNYRGIAEISFPGGYSAISACPSTDQILLDDMSATASGASYYTTSVGTLAWESTVSSKADSSALSSYALSSDVSATVDLVGTQSANWGGSALALSAGNGISLKKTGNTLVMSTDETVLWSGFEKASGTVHSLSEPMSNFERLKFVVSVNSAGFQRASQVTEYDITNNTGSVTYFYPECRTIAANTLTSNILYVSSDSTSNWTLTGGLRYVNTALTTGVGTYDFYVNKIIGINRTAGF